MPAAFGALERMCRTPLTLRRSSNAPESLKITSVFFSETSSDGLSPSGSLRKPGDPARACNTVP